MAAALECWSSRASSTDEDMVEQAVLMRTKDRSEGTKSSESSAAVARVKESSAMQKKLQRLNRNVSEAIESLKNSLNLDSAAESQTTSSKIESCSPAMASSSRIWAQSVDDRSRRRWLDVSDWHGLGGREGEGADGIDSRSSSRAP